MAAGRPNFRSSVAPIFLLRQALYGGEVMEDLAEGFLRGFGRALGYVLVNILFEFFFYYLGWPVVKVFTLGVYPRGADRYGWKTGSHEGAWVSGIGLLVFALAGMACFHYVGLI